jgi:6-phosphogluconolactonase (cycloisomerase 2 family)
MDLRLRIRNAFGLRRRGSAALSLVVLSSVLAGAASSGAQERERQEPNRPLTRGEQIEESRREAGVQTVPKTRHELPNGELRVEPAELLAGEPGQKMEFVVQLERPAKRAKLLVTLPSSWVREAESGITPTRNLRLAGRSGTAARVGRDGTTVELALEQADGGATASFALDEAGIAAGFYSLPFFWAGENGNVRRAGTAEVRFYAPERELARETAASDWSRLAVPGVLANSTDNSTENSEPFIVVSPRNPDRVAVSANDNSSTNYDGGREVWITSNGGRRWKRIVMSDYVDAPQSATTEQHDVCCDPAFAADTLGNIWYSAISYTPDYSGEAPSRIIVNRIGAGSEMFQGSGVGLPARTPGMQDKQMMTIDNSSSSPTYGRLYMVWNEPKPTGGITVVISKCDTRVAGVSQVENCDNADNWSRPAPVMSAPGSYIYADVAVAPTGRVYVTWWDFSATNAIRGTSCQPTSATATNCLSQTFSGWSAATTVAKLNASFGTPIPFFCPTIVDPAGRVGPVPSVEVDRSAFTERGRVYVAWSDLRSGSGTTKCGRNVTPAATHLNWDTFVSSRLNALPGAAASSASVGQRPITDGVGGVAKSEEFLPWLAVDQLTGQAWVDLYSTREDSTRGSAHFFVSGVAPRASGTLGFSATRKVSDNASDYSGGFELNDYGDYAGLDATDGIAYPVWVDNSNVDGEATTYRSSDPQRKPGGALAQFSGLAGCWSEDGGECSNGTALRAPTDVVATRDAKSVYVSTDDYWTDSAGIAAFSRNTTSGALTQLSGTSGCLSNDGTAGQCRNGKALYGITEMVVSPDSKHVYTAGYDNIGAFSRNTTSGVLTNLSGLNGCFSKDGTTYNDDVEYGTIQCRQWRGAGYTSISGITMSPDGKFLYAHFGDYSGGAIMVFSRDTTTGVLTQVAGTAGCINMDATEGCRQFTLFDVNGAEDVVITPDGKNAYVAGYVDLMLFTRSVTTGALTPITTGGCFNEDGARGCVASVGMEYADRVAVSPDNKHVYVGQTDDFWGAIAVFQRNATTGTLSQPDGRQKCVRHEDSYASRLCPPLSSFADTAHMMFSKDGGTLHTGGYYGQAVFTRDATTGALSQPANPYSCATETGENALYSGAPGDCYDGRALNRPEHIALSPDNKQAYVSSAASDAVAVFVRKATTAPPYCASFRATVGQDRGKRIRLLCRDELKNPMTLSIVTPPTSGTLAAIDQNAQTTLYTPPAGFRGSTTFKYKATDSSGTSETATAYITVD